MARSKPRILVFQHIALAEATVHDLDVEDARERSSDVPWADERRVGEQPLLVDQTGGVLDHDNGIVDDDADR